MRVVILDSGAIVVDNWLFGAPANIHEQLKELSLQPQVVFTTSLRSPGIGRLGNVLSFKEMPLSMNGMRAIPILKKHGTDYSIESGDGKILFSERGDVSIDDTEGYHLAIIKNKHRAEKLGSHVITWPWPQSEFLVREGVVTPLETSFKVWSKAEDIPDNLKSMGVSLEQANQIARVAQATTQDGEENWAIAISQFKKGHKKEDDHWVKREKEEMMEKVSKEECNYREGEGTKKCGNCAFYSGATNGVGTCSLVEGEIQADDLCDYFKLETVEKEWVEGMGPVRNFGDTLVADLHKAYNDCSDHYFKMGYMNEEERISIASAIGDALKALRNSAPKEVMQRPISEMMPIPTMMKELAPNVPDKIDGYWSSVYKTAEGQDRWASISSVAVKDRQEETFSTKAMDWALGFAKIVNFKGPLRYRHIPGLDGGDCDFQKRVGDFLFESGTFRDNKMGQRLKELMSQPGKGVSLGLLFSKEDIIDGVYQRALIFERSVTPTPAVPYTSIIIKGKEIEMNKLTEEQLAQLAQELNLDVTEVKTMYDRAISAGGPLGLKEFETALKESMGEATVSTSEEDEPKLSKKDMLEILNGLTVSEFKELEEMMATVKAKPAPEEDDEEEDDDEEEEYEPMPMAKKKKEDALLSAIKQQNVTLKQQGEALTAIVGMLASQQGNTDVEKAVQKVLGQVPRGQANFATKSAPSNGNDTAMDAAVAAKFKELEEQIAAKSVPDIRDIFTSTTLNKS